jgi:hypothetical protein
MNTAAIAALARSINLVWSGFGIIETCDFAEELTFSSTYALFDEAKAVLLWRRFHDQE